MPQLPQSDPIELQNRLSNQDEIFTLSEVYQAVELLAPEMGFNRGEQLPKPGTVRLFTLTVPGFEFLGILQVRLLTNRDRTLVLNMRDKMLGENFRDRLLAESYYTNVSQASFAIVSPPDLVEDILDDTDPEMQAFFPAFAKEYQLVVDDHAGNVRRKKYLMDKAEKSKPDGSVSASMSATEETSSPPTQDG